MIHASLRISGKVQGVFCRRYVQEAAKGLGIFGFVRNEPDGTVFVECECANDEKLEEFVRELKEGKKGFLYLRLKIEDVKALEKKGIKEGKFSDFRIEY